MACAKACDVPFLQTREVAAFGKSVKSTAGGKKKSLFAGHLIKKYIDAQIIHLRSESLVCEGLSREDKAGRKLGEYGG